MSNQKLFLDTAAIHDRWFDHKGSLKEEAIKRNIEEAWLLRDIHDLLTECARLRNVLREEWAENARRMQQEVQQRAVDALAEDIARELHKQVIQSAAEQAAGRRRRK